MKSYLKVLLTTALVVALVAGMGSNLSAQIYWMNPVDGDQLSLEIVKPNFDNDEGIGFMTTSWFLGGRHSFSPRMSIVWELPISHFSIDSDFPVDENETAVGNIYLGVRISDPGNNMNKLIGDLGVRLPVAPDDSPNPLVAGAYANFNKYEAFIPNYMIVSAAGTYRVISSDVTTFNFSFGGDLLFPTEDYNDSEFFIDYSMFMTASFEKLLLDVGFNGKFLASVEGDSFGEKSVHQLALNGFYDSGKIKPGLSIKFPIDEDLNRVINYSFGLNFIYSLE